MSVTHRVDHENKVLTIAISGQFDFTAHPDFRNSYKELDQPSYAAIVDLNYTDNIDSAALGMLLLLDEAFPNTPVKLIHANDFIKNVLHMAHFNKKFDIS
jgi:anti-anti-sigma regulatory factor